MSDLREKHCAPCEGGVIPLDIRAAQSLLQKLSSDWQLGEDAKFIRRNYTFRNFYRTMSFVNAVAHIANSEDHHPDLEIGFNYCRIQYTTHAISGLSENDFICAAKIDLIES